MKKLIILSIYLLITVSFLSLALTPALAVGQDLETSIKDELRPIKNIYDPVGDVTPGTLQETIAKLVQSALGFLAIIFIILFLYAGFTWMTSAGNEDKLSTAKKTMTAAIIGLAIVLTAYAITTFVFYSLFRATL